MEKRKKIIKIIKDIKSKKLSHAKLIESIKKIGEIGDKSFADDLIPLIDEFEDKDLESQMRKVLEDMGIDADYMNQEGIKKEDVKDFNGAIRKYELSIKMDPEHHWAWYNMARMYQENKGDMKKAIELYKKVVSIDENFGDGWNNMGNVYSDLNQISLSREAYERAAECKGYGYKHFPYYNLGLIYEKVNNQKKALDFFLKAIEFKHDYSVAIYNAGRMYKKLGDTEKANEYFAKVMEYDPTYEKDLRKLGVKVEEVITLQILRKLDKFEPEKKREHGKRY